MNAKKITVACPRCNGRRRIASFAHYANGVCFECGGDGVIDVDPLTPSAAATVAMAAERSAAVRSLALKVGNPVGHLIVSCHVERGTWSCQGAPGSLGARIGDARRAFWQEVCDIVDAAVSSRAIRPSAVGRLSELAAAWATFPENA